MVTSALSKRSLATASLSAPSAGRLAKEARVAARQRHDPLDPSSWEGHQVPSGGWSRGLPQTSAPGASGASNASQVPARPKGPLPSPGEVLRMNAANK
mmetsp:Transcript_43300/g.101409  ORF Transcript_43300/g.101409 Transcript_43300/m.101409 type:complete len:98 (+) Transcript_43300:1-294(+)